MFFLLCLALILSGCDNSKHADIIVGQPSPNEPITEAISVGYNSVFLLTTLPTGFIVVGQPSQPTPISYSLSITGDTLDTCDVKVYKANGTSADHQALSGTTYSAHISQFLVVQNCTPQTKVFLNTTYRIGIQAYIGNASFAA